MPINHDMMHAQTPLMEKAIKARDFVDIATVMGEKFKKLKRALWLARYDRACAEAMLAAIKWGLGDDTYIRWKKSEKALEKKLREYK